MRLSANQQCTELLEMLFPDGLDKPPRLSEMADQVLILFFLQLSYQFSGQPNRALELFHL